MGTQRHQRNDKTPTFIHSNQYSQQLLSLLTFLYFMNNNKIALWYEARKRMLKKDIPCNNLRMVK